MGLVAPGDDPGLEGEAGGVGGKGEEVVGFDHDALLLGALLPHNVAEDASLLEIVVAFRPVEFLLHALRHHRQRDQL